MTHKTKLPLIANLETARFECVFPTCGGLCCKRSRPPVEPAEARRIAKVLPRVLPKMRPEARKFVERQGFLTATTTKDGRHLVSIQKAYCVFYNEGCVLHRLGGAEGDTTKYKPRICIQFPLDIAKDGGWEVRQWGRPGEKWDLFCLNPAESPKRASKTLGLEARFVGELRGPKQRWRFRK